MKKILLLLFVIPTLSFGQTKTSVTNGDFYNPLTWDCFCLPASGDNVVINHDLTMNTGIYYTAGTITINPSGSLTQTGINRDIWIDGSGRFINHGDVHVRYFLTSQWTYLENNGNFNNIDSMLTQGVVNNSGTINVYDFLNDHVANFGNFGTMNIQHNMNNQGNFDNYGSIDIGLDFSNCNTQSVHAEFTNNGTMCIANNFLNCNGDELNGSGHYYIGSLASNLGEFSGTFTFHTPTGTMAINGTIGSNVTITTGSCALYISENENIDFQLYPNPATETIFVSEKTGDYTITDIKGQIVKEGKLTQNGINVSDLNNGVYFFKLNNRGVTRLQKL